jgi:hypothetical protein
MCENRSQQFVLNFNCSHLRDYPPTRRFYEQLKVSQHFYVVFPSVPFSDICFLQSYPQEVIPIMDLVVNAEYKRFKITL